MLVDEKELLRIQIQSYEFYAGLIDRAVGGGAQAKLPRWDEQRAAEYRALAEQLRRRLAELEAQDPRDQPEQQAHGPGAQALAEQPPAQATLAPSEDPGLDKARSLIADSGPMQRS
jgi:hypothetical protein